MQVVHVLRKYNPAEWGGTETAIRNLLDGLRHCRVESVLYCPSSQNGAYTDPIASNGYAVKRFKACVPIWGISSQKRAELIAVGGNLFSFGLLGKLWGERDASLIHSHTLGRLGGIALTVARRRRLPFVVTIHGGAMDLPAPITEAMNGSSHGLEWGKPLGMLLKSREVFRQADAILTCNEKEAALLRQNHPAKRIIVQSHSVQTEMYQRDYRETALTAFPWIQNRRILLSLGRIDPIKNQGWLVGQAQEVFRRHPQAMIVLVGACTDKAYGESVKQSIRRLGLEDRVMLTGGFAPADPRLIGLLQMASAVVLPSLAETFGLVILEAWATGTTVICSRTSGASALVKDGQNGWLFDLKSPSEFHHLVDQALGKPELAKQLAAAGRRLLDEQYDAQALAGRMKNLYAQLIEEKHAPR
ncbi:MAG TPA: glycosyltransferase family 4 protein [Candidatus Cybelea sp.]|nr:glycosyltransferase family 4 protein [Candidatus Cybelea sp.]